MSLAFSTFLLSSFDEYANAKIVCESATTEINPKNQLILIKSDSLNHQLTIYFFSPALILIHREIVR